MVEEAGAAVEEPAPVAVREQDVPAAIEDQARPVVEPVKPRRKEPPVVAQAALAGVEDGEPADVEEKGSGLLVQV